MFNYNGYIYYDIGGFVNEYKPTISELLEYRAVGYTHLSIHQPIGQLWSVVATNTPKQYIKATNLPIDDLIDYIGGVTLE